MNFLRGLPSRVRRIVHGLHEDAGKAWFTISIALFIFFTFSVFGLAAGQVQETLANYITTPLDPATPWVGEARETWTSFHWLRVAATFGAVLVFASTLRYWSARLLGSDIDDYETITHLDAWRRDFILITWSLPWIGLAMGFLEAHIAAVDHKTEAATSLQQFLIGARLHPPQFLLLTPFLALSALALLTPFAIHVLWRIPAIVVWRKRISDSKVLRFAFDLPLPAMFAALAILFAWMPAPALIFARALGPIVIISLSFACLTAVGAWLIVVGRARVWPLFLAAALIPTAIGAFGLDANHALSVRAPKSPAPYRIVDALRPYFASPEQQTMPLILVSAEGGGIRAAYFTAGVLARLEDQCPQLARRIFAISGVSGGAVGAAAYVAALKSKIRPLEWTGCHFDRPGPQFYQTRLDHVLAEDHLSPALARQAFPELAQRWIPHPFSFTDRQRGLELSFEQAFTREFAGSNAFASSAFDHMDGSPFLLLNTTRVDDGALYVASPLDLSDGHTDIFDLRQSLWPAGAPDFRLSTMALNSARFPIISPPGTLGSPPRSFQFVDGGYFDNSGAEGIVALEKKLRSAAALLGVTPRIILLHITPNPVAAPAKPPRFIRFSPNIRELEAVLATRNARVQLSLLRMRELVPDCQYTEIKMSRDLHTQFRLGWALSASAASRLKQQVDGAFVHADLSASTCTTAPAPSVAPPASAPTPDAQRQPG